MELKQFGTCYTDLSDEVEIHLKSSLIQMNANYLLFSTGSKH